MIIFYSYNSDGYAAIELFCDMNRNGFRLDNFTFTSVLCVSALIAENERQCQQLHYAVVKSGTWLFTSLLNALIFV